MQILLDTTWIVAVGLVAIRLGAVFVLNPVFAGSGVPTNVRVLWTLALAAILVTGMSARPAFAGGLGDLWVAALSETVLGALLAFGIFTAFAAFQLAGRLIDLQLGFGVASLIDPSTRAPTPLLGTLLHLVALAVFFAVDGHHMLIRGLAFSLEQIPPGTPLIDVEPAAVVAQFGGMFVYAAALAAPVLFVVFLVDVAMAVVARTMPQMNVFIVSLPLKILIGLLTLAISAQYLNPLMTRVFEGLFDYWQNVITQGP